MMMPFGRRWLSISASNTRFRDDVASASPKLPAHPAWLSNFVIAASLSIAINAYFVHLVRSGIMPDGGFYRWWHDCYFSWEIPAFYFSSGFIYQRGATVDTWGAWRHSVLYRLIVNGAPFLAFTLLMLAVNALTGAGPGFEDTADALLVTPLEPYGYFYCLFFIFGLTPTVKTRRRLGVLCAIAGAAKLFALIAQASSWALPYGVIGVPSQMIWFVGGIAVAFLQGERGLRRPGVVGVSGALFVGGSVAFVALGLHGALVTFWCALTGSVALIGLLARWFPDERNVRPLGFLAGYTMAIYLFHPLFLKLLWWAFGVASVTAPIAYIVFGALVALVLPVFTMIGLNHCWKLGFIVYPARYLSLPPA